MKIKSFGNFRISILIVVLFSCIAATYGQQNKLDIHQVNEKLFIFTTYNTYKEELYAANASYLVTKDGVVVFDTPWDSTQYQPLLDSIKAKHNLPVIAVFGTHWHEDRAGGFGYYNKLGIPTYASAETNRLLAQNGYETSSEEIVLDKTYNIGHESFVVHYPGPGHSMDNVVIWLPQYQVLHGGCFIKSEDAKNIGNIADGDIKEWKPSLARLLAKYPDIKRVIPGHDNWQGSLHIRRTKELIESN